MSGFNNPWYALFIERFSPETGNEPLDGLATSILAAACVIAQAIDSHADATRGLRNAITPIAAPGQDAAGCTVDSLTEAAMGITAGLVKLAAAVEDNGIGSGVNDAGDEIAAAVKSCADSITFLANMR